MKVAVVLAVSMVLQSAVYAGTGIENTAIYNQTIHYDRGFAGFQQPDGKIVNCGGAVPSKAAENTALIRLTSSGVLDSSFGSGGIVTTDQASKAIDRAQSCILQSDLKIVAGGPEANNFGLVRYATNGSLDSSFGSSGKANTSFGASGHSAITSMVQQLDGKLVAAGYSTASGPDAFAVARYKTNGSLDTTFNSTGKLLVPPFGTGWEEANGVALTSSGKILLAGIVYGVNGAHEDMGMVQITSSGAIDTSFGSSGYVTLDSTTGDSWAAGVAVQSDGKIVLAGPANNPLTSGGQWKVARFNADGSLDTSFNGSGVVLTDLAGGGDQRITALAIQPADGKIVVGGWVQYTGGTQLAVGRYNTDGSLDTSFGSVGYVITPFSTNVMARGMTLQSDGKIVLFGQSSSGGGSLMTTVRYNSDGSLDTSF